MNDKERTKDFKKHWSRWAIPVLNQWVNPIDGSYHRSLESCWDSLFL